MEEIEQLQYISLVSKVCTDLENHLGINDKDLAEFIIDLAKRNPTLEGFKSALLQNGAEFDDSLSASLLRRIKLMANLDASNDSAPAEDEARSAGLSLASEADRKVMKQKLPALAMPNEPVKRLMNELDDLFSKYKGKVEKDEINGDAEDSEDRKDNLSPRKRKESKNSSRTRRRSSSREAERRKRRRSRSPTGRRRSRSRGRLPKLDKEPIEGKIYDGCVTGIRDFGCFVELLGLLRRFEGLVHVSQLKNQRVSSVGDVVRRRQKVKVKVLKFYGTRVSLSMKEVDQETGEDLNPGMLQQKALDDDAHFRNPDLPGALSKTIQDDNNEAGITSRSKYSKRLSSPERWELKQMMAANCISIAELPDFDEDMGILKEEADDGDEDIEIELVEEEAPFLQGYGRMCQDLEPIKVVKNPDGGLSRAPNVRRSFLDPMADAGTKYSNVLDSERKHDLPEWKRHITGGRSYGKPRTLMSILEQRQSLPISKLRDELVKAVEENQILIVIGETGSGKTTQITQYLAEEGYTRFGKIGCTQPRRVAAMSVAKRVSEEFGCRLGQEVGYTIRFEDCTSQETIIKYMTDGMMLRECLLDPDLGSYSVIMLDEAHERTIHTDVLFGLCKQAVTKRPNLKLIVTSATLDAVKFSQYFFAAPIFTIPGRTFAVEIMYTREPETDYLDASLITVMQIHLTEPPGDILVFLTGQEEIDTACEILFERMKSLGPDVPELIILPVYSALPSEMQTRIFEPAPPGSRKVVIATNIAETSLTIDGIFYVVDPGFVKQKIYNPKTGMDSLVVSPISQAQAKQRAGRAGRTGPGKCYRLYTERAYRDEMLPSPVPEIQRTNLASTLLQLKAMGINNLIDFDFMDPPPMEAMIMALEQLHSLSALDDEGLLTRLGRRMAEFPLEPTLSKLLIISVHLGCSEEVLTIVSMLSVQNVFYRPKDKQDIADQKKSKFHQPEGDHLTLLAVYNSWRDHRFSHAWCYENFVQIRTLKRAQDIRKQLLGIMDRHKLDMLSCGKNVQKVQKAICSGFFRNAAKKDPQEGYRTLVDSQSVYIHPSSTLFQHQPEWVVYHELVMTTKEYMREVCAVEPKWLVEFAPAFFRFGNPTKLSKFKKGQKIEPLFNKYEDVNAWRISRVKKKIYNPNR
uniref:RNA helicase n=1 Tax=Trichuris muris TaxID=70415 RepID=A0A5S6PYS7_TRIMR